VQQHVLRFWETKFNQIRPMKRGGGRRYYRAEDVALLKHIYTLLYSEGYTIKGAQKLLKGQSKGSIAAAHAANDAADKASRAAQNASPVISAPKPVVTPQPVKVEALSSSVAEALVGLLSELKELRAMVSKTA
jgi:DNA-binding transcriptional MerR regulator